MLAIAHSCAVIGLDGHLVEVQVDFNPRSVIPSFTIVGLPDAAVKESKERIRAAIKNTGSTAYRGNSSPQVGDDLETMFGGQKRQEQEEHHLGLRFPNKAYVVNLSPADLPKHGPSYDLPIAVAVLAATDQIPLHTLEKSLFIGELSLDGRVRHVKGTMPMVYTAAQAGYQRVFVPKEDALEAALITNIEVLAIETLGELVEFLYGMREIAPTRLKLDELAETPPIDYVDFADVKGQEHVKRALEIAAAGNHNVRLVGPPGVGKSLLARAIPGILPRLSFAEALEVTRIYSVADMLHGNSSPLMTFRPYRAPHHTISQAGLVGGGSMPKPGEISLAHRGVLFLDEINELNTKTLEVMRQPIEDKVVTISRAKGSLSFPANFMLVAAHNPCPCGYYGDSSRACSCSPTMISRYQAKLSGPLLDRIDIHVDVPRVDYEKLMGRDKGENSATIQARVEEARAQQTQRFQGRAGLFANGDMGAGEIQEMCVLEKDAQQILEVSVKRMQLSARSYHRVLKLSRTIADLATSPTIKVQHVAEALQYRPK